jgi:hypothetical protein
MTDEIKKKISSLLGTPFSSENLEEAEIFLESFLQNLYSKK